MNLFNIKTKIINTKRFRIYLSLFETIGFAFYYERLYPATIFFLFLFFQIEIWKED